MQFRKHFLMQTIAIVHSTSLLIYKQSLVLYAVGCFGVWLMLVRKKHIILQSLRLRKKIRIRRLILVSCILISYGYCTYLYYIENIPADTYSFWAFLRPRFGHFTSNVVESLNGAWQKSIRHLPPLRMMAEGICYGAFC